jgi:hypothetical protein
VVYKPKEQLTTTNNKDLLGGLLVLDSISFKEPLIAVKLRFKVIRKLKAIVGQLKEVTRILHTELDNSIIEHSFA